MNGSPALDDPNAPPAIWKMAKYADVGLAFGVVGVIIILVIPIPTQVLDLLLCV